MPELPHGTSSSLDQMWKRIYRTIQDMVHQEIIRVFGMSWNGGTFAGASVSGVLPSGVGGASVAAASLRWEPVGDSTGSMLTDSSGNPIMAVVTSP